MPRPSAEAGLERGRLAEHDLVAETPSSADAECRGEESASTAAAESGRKNLGRGNVSGCRPVIARRWRKWACFAN